MTSTVTHPKVTVFIALALAVGAMGVYVVKAHAGAATAPLIPQPQDVPSVLDPAQAPQYAAAVDHARQLLRAAVVDQHLPGLSVAVGAGGRIAWAEGFGWRDVDSRTAVTPKTRFHIGTAPDLVRVGLASGSSSIINGELAGGMVMSLVTRRDSGVVVAVLSNIAHANTSALGLKIADAFAQQGR